jgi:glycosyltransferase involved in cell wall biosynthesis
MPPSKLQTQERLPRERPRRILILNWRDARHPRAGGAEIHTHRLARRLVEAGHYVEWFAATYQGAPRDEVVDGVRIVRAGGQSTVHLRAFLHYGRTLKDKFDLVIDQVNTIPFFAPVWSGITTWMMIWQLAREVWWYESAFPMNALGYLLEPIYLRAYRNTEVLTYSESTKRDLRSLGFQSNITVLPVAVEAIDKAHESRHRAPQFIYVGRLAPSKRIGDIIRAFARFRSQFGNGTLVLVGSGPDRYVRDLERLAMRLSVSDGVVFRGWITGEAKHELMASAFALLMASAREGWGLVVSECNSCGTPAIVYDVAGLRDSVRNLETGLVVRESPEALAQGMARLATDTELYRRLQEGAVRWSKLFTSDAGLLTVHQMVCRLPSTGGPG